MVPDREHGRTLLTTLIDVRAANNHKRPYYSIPVSKTLDDGFRDISYRTFANAVNRCAHWLRGSFGTSTSFEHVVYLGPFDLRYQILAMAAVKTGHVMFFPSARNSAEAFDKLLEDAKATMIVSDPSSSVVVNNILSKRQMTHVHVPALESLLDDDPVPNIQFDGNFDKYRFKPWVLLHTSGSTGMPKLVTLKHGFATAIDAHSLLPINEPVLRYGNMRTFIPFPPFHVAGLNYSLPCIAWVDSTAVLPPVAPVTADVVHQAHQLASVEYSFLAPSLVSDLAKNQTQLEDLARLNGLTFSGGPLPQETAGLVSQKTRLDSTLGATEYGGVPSLPKDPEDWAYFRFNEEIGGLRFRETEIPDIYELVFTRQRSLDLLQAIFVTFPDLDEYHTKDCFSKHPTKPKLWRYEYRLDDIIVFSNGEKLNPITMEGIITTCPAVKSCLIVGQGQFQSALIIEPKDHDVPQDQLLREVEPFIARANDKCGTRAGRLTQDLIFFIPPEKTFSRAAKGTIQRARSNQIFAEEIRDLYDGRKTPKNNDNPVELVSSSVDKTKTSLAAFLQRELGTDKVRYDEDFFAYGMDSLLVINLVRFINNSLKGRSTIDAKFVYDHPTVDKLAVALHDGPRTKEYSDFDSDDEDDKQTWISMNDMYEDLRRGLPSNSSKAKHRPSRHVLQSSRPPPIFQPDGGMQAWLQVLGSFLINVNTWGIVNSFGVFQAYYESTHLSSYSSMNISWVGTLQGTLLLVIGVVAGPLFDRGYFRTILVASAIGLVLAFMMLSLTEVNQYYQVMLSHGILSGLCLGLLYIPSIALVPLYFKSHRGLALGLATAGGSVGGVIYPIVFRALLSGLGFGWATRIIGFIALAILTVATMILKPVGARSTGVRQLFDSSALKDIPYVTFMIAGFLLFAGALVPYWLTTTFAKTGLDGSTSVDLSFHLLAVINAAQFFGRVIPAWLSDHIGGEIMLLLAEIAIGVLGFCWIAVHNLGGYVAWLVFFGLASGMVVTLPAIVLPYILPTMAVIGTRLGMLYAVGGIGLLISTPVSLALNDAAGSYLGSQVWIGCCGFAATLFYAITCRQAWKRRRLYKGHRGEKV